jgi:SAM-dependent methyltransferase
MKKCSNCGVIFLDPPPDPKQFSAILADGYIKDEARLERAFGRTREPVLSRVAAKILEHKSRGRILDVGCAGGHFLKSYFSGTSWETFGIEPSNYGSARAADKGIKIYRGEISDVKLPAGFFDVITVLDVLCYILDPQEELLKLRNSLKPDGLLVVEQPVAGTHIWRHVTKLGRLLGGPPMVLLENSQMFLYEMRSMRLLLHQTGFKEIEYGPLPGNRQRRRYRDVIFGSYYVGSRLAWCLSGRRLMLGPNFVVVASLA